MSESSPQRCYSCGRPAAEHFPKYLGSPELVCPARTRGGVANVTLITFGALIAAGGALVWLVSHTTASECSSGLLYALDQSQCSTYTTLHTVGGIAAITGLVLLIVGLVLFIVGLVRR
jgi:hypothetical protein